MTDTSGLEYRPPKPALLRSIACQKLHWKEALGEWIDNALDAEATQIEIILENARVCVRDNGSGCPQPLDIVQLGARTGHGSTRLGYGGEIGRARSHLLNAEQETT